MALDFLHKRGVGFSGMTFGVMEGVLAVTSVLVGLGTVANKETVFIAMIIVGTADAMGNAAGIRVSQETVVHTEKKQIFLSMLLAFLSTFIVTLILVLPVMFLDIIAAIIVSLLIGILFMVGLGVFVGTRRKYDSGEMFRLIAEYIITAMIIVGISYTLGLIFTNPWVAL